MAQIEYLLWDFDGTLAYRDGMWTDTLYTVLLRNEITYIKKEDLRPLLNIGFTWHSPDTSHKEMFLGKKWWEYYEDYFTEIFKILSVPEDISKRLSSEVRNEYIDYTKWHIYEDVIRTLEECITQGYTNVIVSNHIPELPELVQKLCIDTYFYRIYSSAQIGYEKPNKNIFDYVIKDLHTINTKCIMIGDSYEADIAGAIRSNIKPILVRKDNSKAYKRYCKSLIGIPEILQSIEKE